MFSIWMPYLAINFTNISPDSYWDSASMSFASLQRWRDKWKNGIQFIGKL